MPSYKLHYFNARGWGEMIRLMFAQQGQQYEDVRYTPETWPETKPSKFMSFSYEFQELFRGRKVRFLISCNVTRERVKP